MRTRHDQMTPQLPCPAQPAKEEEFIESGNFAPLCNYLEDLRAERGKIEFLGLPALIDTSAPVPLGELFVEPAVSDAPLAAESFDDPKPPVTQRLLDALTEHQRLVLLGDPGMGKSTVVNWICESFASPAGSVMRQRLGPLVPLPFILRDLGIGSGISWPQLSKAFLTQTFAARWRKQETLLKRLLESGQAILLFDGIDELGSVPVREALRQAIWQAMDKFPRCRFLLTSRVVGYDEVPFDVVLSNTPDKGELLSQLGSANPEEVEPGTPFKPGFAMPALMENRRLEIASRCVLAPFTDAQIATFAGAWWRHHRASREKSGKEAADFLLALRGSAGTGTLARIPNLLTLIALVYKTFIQLPDGRADLYQRIAQAYLENIDRHYGLPLPFAHHEMARWLGHIAWKMQRRRLENTKNEDAGSAALDLFASRKDVLGWLSDAIRPQRSKDAEKIAETFLDFAERRSGLFLPRGGDRYGFLHLSFQEYFAALHLQDAIGSEDWWEAHAHAASEWEAADTSLAALGDSAGNRLWRETFIFLFELLSLQNHRLPARRLKLLLGADASSSGWSKLRARFTLNEIAEPESKQITPAAVELTAALSVNPHIAFEEKERRELWNCCWEWELARQEEERFTEDNPVAKLLTSRARFIGEALGELKNHSFKRLSLSGCTGVNDLEPLAGLSALQWLSLAGCTGVNDLEPLAGLSALQSLYLNGCTGVNDLEPLAGLSALQSLYLNGCTGVNDLEPLAGLSALQSLDVTGCTGVNDLEPLAWLSALQYLSLNGCAGVNDLEPLAGLSALQWLYLDGCAGVNDLEPLAGLSALQSLDVTGCTGVNDLEPLAGLSALKYLFLSGCTGLSEASLKVVKELKTRSVKVFGL